MSKKEVEHNKVNRPNWVWALTEGGRALIEYGVYIPYKKLKHTKAKGDGHPVWILPGFLASDKSTDPMRNFIHKLGYKVYGWGQGRNLANQEYIETLVARLKIIFEKHKEPVSIIGWSLGGIYARQLAKERPDMVRQVITMGSPFKGITRANNAKWIYDLFLNKGKKSRIDPDLIDDIPNPAPVPTTAIYTKEDGVVPWKYCLEQIETPIHQNIQVRGSHLGLGVNPSVLHIIADRLQYEDSNWVHFEAKGLIEDYLYYPSLESA
jgi:pimeloyl-ACP methyl ester carboxylesterase